MVNQDEQAPEGLRHIPHEPEALPWPAAKEEKMKAHIKEVQKVRAEGRYTEAQLVKHMETWDKAYDEGSLPEQGADQLNQEPASNEVQL